MAEKSNRCNKDPQKTSVHKTHARNGQILVARKKLGRALPEEKDYRGRRSEIRKLLEETGRNGE